MPWLWRQFRPDSRRRITVVVYIRRQERNTVHVGLSRSHRSAGEVRIRPDAEAEAIASAVCLGRCAPAVFADWLEENALRCGVSRGTPPVLARAAAWLRKAKPSTPLTIRGWPDEVRVLKAVDGKAADPWPSAANGHQIPRLVAVPRTAAGG